MSLAKGSVLRSCGAPSKKGEPRKHLCPNLSPLIDGVFKLIFGDRRHIHILTSFFKVALNIPHHEYEQLTVIDPYLKREYLDDKMSILDVKVRTKSGMVINVEMQIAASPELRKRLTFNTAKLLMEQIEKPVETSRIEWRSTCWN